MTTTTITGLPNAATPLSGAERVPMDQAIGAAIAASALVAGTGYQIESVGSTNWTACGLPAGVTAAVGLTFVATAAGTGTGTAIAIETRDASTQEIANLAPGTNLTYDAQARVLSSSTGEDVTLPLAGADAGLISAADQAKLTSIILDRAKLTVADVRNNSGVSIPKGAPVIVTGSSGTIKTVALADASLEATAANTLGLAADTIANNSDGPVITEGPLTGLNTAGLTEGQLIWLSETAGAITSTRPTQPAHGVVLGWCVKTSAGSAGILYVKIDNGQELNELHDVLITSPATGQVLRRAADGLWKNAALSAADVGADTSGTAAAAVAAHAAAADPHPSYTTATEAAAAAPVQSVAGRTGAITLDVSDVANAVATNDARLSDARPPLAHNQLAETISDFSTAVSNLFTTVGNALRTLANPTAVSFLRINANNTVSARSASEMRGDLGLGSAALGTIGTVAGNLVALDGSARLPAVDGSQLTNLPAATTPGGSTTQIQYNNAGAFAGLSTFTTDGTNVTLSGRLTNSANGAASAPPLSLTGTWFSGGTATTTKPQFLIEPSGTTSTGWSTAGTAFGVNAASGFTGNLLDLQVNGTSQASVGSDGKILATGGNGTAVGGFRFVSQPNIGMFLQTTNIGAGSNVLALRDNSGSATVAFYAGIAIRSTHSLGWSSGTPDASPPDLILIRDAADTLAQRRATSAQTFRIYNTFTSATDHERGYLSWASNVFRVGTEKGSSGGTARALELQTDGATRAQISATGVWRNTQPAPAAVNTTATLTIANLQTGIITTTTAAAVDMTLPTGTDVEGGFAVNSNDLAFMWSIINTGGNAATILAATGHTFVGSAAVTANTSGRFTTRRTAANTYVTYRLS